MTLLEHASQVCRWWLSEGATKAAPLFVLVQAGSSSASQLRECSTRSLIPHFPGFLRFEDGLRAVCFCFAELSATQKPSSSE